MKDSFGARIKAARKAVGLSQQAVADQLGVTNGALSQWESNRTFPQLDTFIRLCALYHASADQLLFQLSPGAAGGVGERRAEYADPELERLLNLVRALPVRQRDGLARLLEGLS